MKTDFLLVFKHKLYLAIFCIYVFVCVILCIWLCEQLHQKQHAQWQFQLASYSKSISSKVDYIENLVSGIASLYSQSEQINHTQLRPLIDDQMNGLPFETSIDFFYRILSTNRDFIARYMQQVGVFDFTIIDSETLDTNDINYVLLASYPESDFGHLVGNTLRLDKQNQQAFIVKKWKESDFWSVILNSSDSKTISLRFNFNSFFDYIHAVGDTQNQHILINLNQQNLYNSDWKNEFNLAQQTPLAVKKIKFFDKQLDVAYFDTTNHGVGFNFSYQAISFFICTLAILFGLALLMYLTTIRHQYTQVNRIVKVRTHYLNRAKQELIDASKLKVAALEHQLKAEQKYKTLFLNSSEGLFRCNCNGYVLDANPAFYAFEIFAPQQNNICTLMSDTQKVQFLSLAREEFKEEVFVKSISGKLFCLLMIGYWFNHESEAIFEGRLLNITNKKQREEKLKYQAEHDALTDLLNRQTFLECLSQELTKHQGVYYLLYFDLDRFKLVNDGYGHKMGDFLLKSLAQLLRTQFSVYGEVARLGGDEFASYISGNKLSMPIDDMLAQFSSAIDKLKSDNIAFQCITVSIGVRKIAAPCEVCPEQLLHESDIAMYRAKQNGRDQYCFYNDELAFATKRKRQIETFCSNQGYLSAVSLVYQPIYCVQSKVVLGFEALLRVESDSLGKISPLEFVPVIEEMGKITEVGLYIAKLAAKFCHTINQNAQQTLFVNVNVSPIQLKNNHLIDWLITQQVVAKHLLKIEITESAMMENQADMVTPLKSIADAGYSVLIDDFGTGYSSLSRLKALPINGLKIDRAFINDLTSDAGLQIVKAICAIAKSLNLKIVAEGVENFSQMRKMEELLVDNVQGYLFSKPLNEKKVMALVKRHALRNTA